MNFYSGKFLRRSLANGSTVLESTFKYAERARPFKYTDGTGVSYYLRGLAVWPALIALQIFKCRYGTYRTYSILKSTYFRPQRSHKNRKDIDSHGVKPFLSHRKNMSYKTAKDKSKCETIMAN